MKQDRRWPVGRIVNGAVSLLIMGLIFWFSAGTGDESSDLSRRVTEWLLPLIYPDYTRLSKAHAQGVFLLMHFLVRKGAHFTVFALLGAALRQFLRTFPLKKPALLAFGLTALYAVGDECHQWFVIGRSAQPADVLIDCAGALVGVACAVAVATWLRGRIQKRGMKNS